MFFLFQKKIRFFLLVLLLFTACKSVQSPSSTPELSDEVAAQHVDSLAIFKALLPAYQAQKPNFHKPHTPPSFWKVHHTVAKVQVFPETKELQGEVTLTLSPYAQAQDSLSLYAFGFSLQEVVVLEQEREFKAKVNYDGSILKLHLPTPRKTQRKIRLKYRAFPERRLQELQPELAQETGVHFVRPSKFSPEKGTQIWTNGLKNGNAAWLPILPEKGHFSTLDLYLRFPENYKTLAVGKRDAQVTHEDGTQTSHWTLRQPLPVERFFFAASPHWQKAQVGALSLWLEEESLPYVKNTFKETESIKLFLEKKLGKVNGYSPAALVMLRDFPFGGMAHGGTVAFMEGLSAKNSAEATQNWERTLAAVFAESWLMGQVYPENNDQQRFFLGLAQYLTLLWLEERHGIAEAAHFLSTFTEKYYTQAAQMPAPLLTENAEQWASESYLTARAFLLLHQIRLQLGKESFLEGLQQFLKARKGQATEAEALRLAWERSSGQSLQHVFSQWVYGPSHPKLLVNYQADSTHLRVHIRQTQDSTLNPDFYLPLEFKIWDKSPKGKVYKEVLESREATFRFPLKGELKNIAIGAGQGLLAEVSLEKPAAFWLHQLAEEDGYFSEIEAIENLGFHADDTRVLMRLFEKLADKRWYTRFLAAKSLAGTPPEEALMVGEKLKELFAKDPKDFVRGAALESLFALGQIPENLPEFLQKEESYFMRSNLLFALAQLQDSAAIPYLESQESIRERHVRYALAYLYGELEVPGKLPWYVQQIKQVTGQELHYLLNHFAQYAVLQPENIKKEGIQVLTFIAQENSNLQTREEAFKMLVILRSRSPEVAEILQKIQQQEKNAALRALMKEML